MQKGFAGIIILIVALILAGLAGAYYFGKSQTINPQPLAPQACTDEAMVCPDGSAVGRTGLNCEFAPCPKGNKTDEGKVCGGLGGEKGQFACPAGYKCKYPEPMYLDAQGKCVKE